MIILALVVYIRINHALQPEQKIIFRSNSPDERVEAILVSININATTPEAYWLYIVPKGSEPQKGFELMRFDRAEDLSILWERPKLLKINYKKARIFYFANFWQSENIDNYNYIVELKLNAID